jgi:class 3 adenylate cyclase/tetratricopeptide (TPR) repeat protein
VLRCRTTFQRFVAVGLGRMSLPLSLDGQRFSVSAFQRFSVSAFQRFSVSAFQRFSVSAFQRFAAIAFAGRIATLADGGSAVTQDPPYTRRMAVCGRCGESNPERARFCLACGARLAEPEPSETRKTVTVLFCDVTGSTAIGEALDAESLRRVMSRYFDRMQAVLERHGGTVEKFIGDAIMAVFGIPSLHEDDGVRAVRAAGEMRGALALLNDELDRDYGVRIAIRTGINTGEVVAGDPSAGQKLVTGDAVNVAARLEQAASPGDVLIGPETHRLVRDAARLEPVEPLKLKGKSERVAAWRLVELLPDVPAFGRQLNAPFIGRADELLALERALVTAVQERSCMLATIVGPPGIGKSRLARELVGSVGESARVVVGRCLPYGDGITYWPLAEIVRQVAGTDARAGVEQLAAGEAEAGLIAARIASAIGAADTAGPPEETAWSFRKFLEALAHDRPLLAIVDDIHWAEPTLLDLLEYLVSFSSGAPILLLCLARPDIFELRPSWLEPRPNSTLLTLKPLSEAESERLIERLLAERDLSKLARGRIVEAAAGNPLFVEQMLAMQAEQSPEDGELTIPPTIQALLAARIDRLSPWERAVIERASVEGRMFHRSALAELLPNGARRGLGAHLMSLIRKEFIRPDQALFAGDDGFRFGHILIRDAAHESMPKQLRAELHERFADWLERKAGKRAAEYEEIIGYHLEQAFRYRLQLGPADVRARALATRGAVHLRSAGERAVARGDMPGAANLLGRTVDLLPDNDPTRAELLPELGTALIEVGELTRATSTLQLALEAARAAGEERAEWRARLGHALAQVWMGASQQEAGAVAEEAAQALARVGDELGVARAWNLVALTRFWGGSTAVAEEAWSRALEHSRRAQSPREEAHALTWLLVASWAGPAPVEQALARCREIVERAPTRQVEAFALLEQGPLLAMQGHFAEARELFRQGRAMLEDLGLVIFVAGSSQEYFDLEMLAGDPAAAEADLRRACKTLERLGEKGFLSTRAGCLAHALCAQGRYEEAVAYIELAANSASADDALTQALWRSALAKVVARRGDIEEALKLAREATAILEPTDWLSIRADTLVDLAETLRLADRPPEVRAALDKAVMLYERKGNVIAAGKARELLDDLRTTPIA